MKRLEAKGFSIVTFEAGNELCPLLRNYGDSAIAPVADHSLPSGKLRKLFRMNYAGQNLQTIDNARTRPGEISSGVDDVDSAVLCGRK